MPASFLSIDVELVGGAVFVGCLKPLPVELVAVGRLTRDRVNGGESGCGGAPAMADALRKPVQIAGLLGLSVPNHGDDV